MHITVTDHTHTPIRHLLTYLFEYVSNRRLIKQIRFVECYVQAAYFVNPVNTACIKNNVHPKVEFSRAVLGTIALIGNDILVKLRSPLMIFFPINFIIYFPIDLTLLT